MDRLPRLKDIDFLRPPIWARGGHLQTILSHVIPSDTVKAPLEEHIVPLKDGDRLKLHLYRGKVPVMVSLFHGLGGDITSDYMQRTGILSEKKGYSFALVNHRGAHSGAGLARNPYHSGRGEDASDVFEWLFEKFPKHFHVGIGVSMSGSILLNLLSGRRGQCKPHAGITVNAPLDLQRGARKLSEGLNRIYDIRFVKRLSREIQLKYELGLQDRQYKIPPLASVYDFDQIYTGPATEFKTRENYYSSCSVIDHLMSVDRPCIMLTSVDDPFVDVQDYFRSKKSDFIQTHIEPTGGHVGYLSFDYKKKSFTRWLDYFLEQTIPRLYREHQNRTRASGPDLIQ